MEIYTTSQKYNDTFLDEVGQIIRFNEEFAYLSMTGKVMGKQ